MILYFMLVLPLTVNCVNVMHSKQHHEVTTKDLSNNNDFKPINFTLQFTAYVDYNDENSLVYESSAIPLLVNDEDYYVHFDESRRSIKFASRLTSNYDNTIPVNDSKIFEGKMGQVTNSGTWKHQHQESFTFKIGGKQYFWGQSILERYNVWFIHELLPDGRMGDETDRRMVADYFHIVSPFTINGRQFFYGHSSVNNTNMWFIRELLPDGRIGEETDRGLCKWRYLVSFPFTIDGRHYFYGHKISDGTHSWHVNELLPNGLMGIFLPFGGTDYLHAFSFFINGRLFFFGQTRNHNKKWCIEELSRGGLIGPPKDCEVWNIQPEILVPFKVNGKQYFYVQTTGRTWFIRELLPNGRMGNVTDRGVWNENYSVVVTFNMKGKQFLYFHSHETKNWFIRSLH